MQKTPISILQEMMVQKGKVPNYHLIHDGGGSHENTFTYEVSCEGLTAKGTGRCKKDAKHTAAKNMLEAIAKYNALPALPASPADSPVRTPLPKPMPASHILQPDEPFINAIGELQDLCAENELAEPVYETINDVGPPHARVFTIQCIVSSFREEGKATTKKQAKHEAARKMCTRIKELVENTKSSSAFMQINDDDDDIKGSDVKALFYNKFYRKKDNLGVKVADYHMKLTMHHHIEVRHEIVKKLEEWRHYLRQNDISELGDPFETLREQLKEILSPLNIDMQKIVITTDEKNFMVAIYLNTTPEINQVQIGSDINQMIVPAIFQIIDALVLLLL
ncbi:hypothetical protein PV325_005881 [Microctonus aethiopoides]|nr:hypothetical protein PV325_005881 [Microctonus aethiopoides]KAK0178416.1 hypothetical protein PV328_002365 [Microctonus aethiopoides]